MVAYWLFFFLIFFISLKIKLISLSIEALIWFKWRPCLHPPTSQLPTQHFRIFKYFKVVAFAVHPNAADQVLLREIIRHYWLGLLFSQPFYQVKSNHWLQSCKRFKSIISHKEKVKQSGPSQMMQVIVDIVDSNYQPMMFPFVPGV